MVIEAEKYWEKIARSSHDWAPSTAKSGYSGTGAMYASPNNGGAYDTGYTTTSPEMRYQVDIRQTGTYYVWLRLWADSTSDDSAHAGLDDQAVSSADRIYPNKTGAWVWTRLTADGPYATLNITTPGVRTLNIWAREDGLYIDKIVMTTQSNYFMIGTGPAESVRGPVYVYDGDGNRVRSVEAGSVTAYIGSWYESITTPTGTTMKRYYYAGSTRIAMREGAGAGASNLTFLFGDHLGSTSVSYKADESLTKTQLYKVWGENRWPTTSELPTTYRFTGQRAETSLGIYFFNARWYDPWLGRFLQADSIIPNPGNPLDWDRYAYARNNALRYTDPTGHEVCDEDGNCFEGRRYRKINGQRRDVPLTENGAVVAALYRKMRNIVNDKWNPDGDLTIEEFLGLWILHEANGIPEHAAAIASAVAQSSYVGGYNPAYCFGTCRNGLVTLP